MYLFFEYKLIDVLFFAYRLLLPSSSRFIWLMQRKQSILCKTFGAKDSIGKIIDFLNTWLEENTIVEQALECNPAMIRFMNKHLAKQLSALLQKFHKLEDIDRREKTVVFRGVLIFAMYSRIQNDNEIPEYTYIPSGSVISSLSHAPIILIRMRRHPELC